MSTELGSLIDTNGDEIVCVRWCGAGVTSGKHRLRLSLVNNGIRNDNVTALCLDYNGVSLLHNMLKEFLSE